MKKLNIAVVGLRFGLAFAEIYKDHPLVDKLHLCDTNPDLLINSARMLGTDQTALNVSEILENPEIDAVHLATPIPLHEEQSVMVLESGKHCACAVPMAVSIDGIKKIIAAVNKTDKIYMMMETMLYTHHYLYAKSLLSNGILGQVQFLRGFHNQDMYGWPDYWKGLPPMYYATHAISPLAGIAGSRIKKVCCAGSGELRDKNNIYNNPFPVESSLLLFENDLSAEVTRSLFDTVTVYREGFSVYGSRQSFEWGFDEPSPPVVTYIDNGGIKTATPDIPNFYKHLPETIQKYTVGQYYDPNDHEGSLKIGRGGGHHGSHPRLVHEFLDSIISSRQPEIDPYMAANITAAGICSHISAMNGCESVEVPVF